jgi:rare lipoprotein A (peptidoglycan hydrolase)
MTSAWTVPIALAAEHSTATTTSTTTTTTTTAPPPVVATAVATVHQVVASVVTTTTTTTTAPPPRSYESGVASWYGTRDGTCASPYLSFGTVVTVTDVGTGGSIRCTVDDRQARNPGRVIDLSYDNFAQLASPRIGLIEVRVSW